MYTPLALFSCLLLHDSLLSLLR